MAHLLRGAIAVALLGVCEITLDIWLLDPSRPPDARRCPDHCIVPMQACELVLVRRPLPYCWPSAIVRARASLRASGTCRLF
jgi:hypothetical protein